MDSLIDLVMDTSEAVDEAVDTGIDTAKDAALASGMNADVVEAAGDLAGDMYDDAKEDFLNGDDDEKDPNDEVKKNPATKAGAVKDVVKTAFHVTKLAGSLLMAFSGDDESIGDAVENGVKVLDDFKKLRKRFKKNNELHPSKKYQGSWAVTSIEGVMDHLTMKHGKDKAIQLVEAKNYTIQDMDSPHHFEVMNIQGNKPRILGTSYYFLAPNESSGDAISQTIYGVLDNKTMTGPFPGPLGTMVHVTVKYHIYSNEIYITYSGKKTSIVKRYFDCDGILTEEFMVDGSTTPIKTKKYIKVSDNKLVFSPSYGLSTGKSYVIKKEVATVKAVKAYWLPNTLQIVGLSVYFKGDFLPTTVGQTDETETKRAELPSKNVSFNIWTSNNNPLSGSVCAIQFGDATKPINQDNPIIGVLPDNPVPFLYNVPAYPLYCIGFICVFDKDNGQLNSFASLNTFEKPSSKSVSKKKYLDSPYDTMKKAGFFETQKKWIQGNKSKSKKQNLFIDGEYNAYYTSAQYGQTSKKTYKMNLKFEIKKFSANEITGKGKDDIDSFEIIGVFGYVEDVAKIAFTKKYTNNPALECRFEYNVNNGFTGTWINYQNNSIYWGLSGFKLAKKL